MENLAIPENIKLISMDATSLYTSIPQLFFFINNYLFLKFIELMADECKVDVCRLKNCSI
jgi:hypothetical protein